MGLLIDTSVLVAAERGQLDLERLLARLGGEEVAIASITASELLHGVHRLRGASRARSDVLVERLLDRLPVVDFDLAAARVHATLSAELRARGTPVGAHDLLIAATAVLLDYAVATRDLRSFPRIKGLKTLTW
jgi:predicted nucleic acid-binding protein